jgi:hypothetical protein
MKGCVAEEPDIAAGAGAGAVGAAEAAAGSVGAAADSWVERQSAEVDSADSAGELL